MARRRALSSREVEALREVGMHWISDNLYLQIREQGTRSWLFRYWVDGSIAVPALARVRCPLFLCIPIGQRAAAPLATTRRPWRCASPPTPNHAQASACLTRHKA